MRQEILDFCHRLGKNKLLVQGGGGNVSWKTKSKLWIKASGTNLGSAKYKNIFTAVDLNQIKNAIKNKKFFQRIIFKPKNLEPSIETFMHAVIPHKVVIHLHSIDFLSILIRGNCSNLLKKKLSGYDYSLLKYVKPGGDLAREIVKKKIKYNKINLILLKNHGIILSSDNLKLIKNYLKIILKEIKTSKKKYLIKKKIKPKLIDGYKLCNSYKIQNLILNKKIFLNIKSKWAISPDHVNYLGQKPIIIKSISKFKKFNVEAPFLFFKNYGVYENLSNTQNHKDQLVAYYETMIRQINYRNIKVLNKKQINEIIFWDKEIYRRNLKQ